jgi:hypothetical protein
MPKNANVINKIKVIHWVCFNVHKDHVNHYRELLLLFKSFCELKINFAKFDTFWKDAYLSENKIK